MSQPWRILRVFERGRAPRGCQGGMHRAAEEPSRVRRGMTLFEVLLALAIFVGSMAAISQIISGGLRGAVQGRLQSLAVIRCQSKLSELVAGSIPFQATGATPFADDVAWSWSLTLQPTQQADLHLVEVTVTHESQNPAGRASFTLRRMLRDPQLYVDAIEAAALREASEAAESTNPVTGTSGSGSTGGYSGGSTGGGS